MSEQLRFGPLSGPRVLTNPNLKIAVQSLLRKKDVKVDDIIKTARAIHAALPKPSSAKDARAQYLDVAFTCIDAGLTTFGTNKYNKGGGERLLTCYLCLLVNEVRNDVEELETAIRETAELTKTPRSSILAEYFRLKLDEYCCVLRMKARALGFARALNVDASDSITAISRELGVGNLVRAAMGEMVVLRKYGVKTAFFEDGATHSRKDVWLFIDPTAFGGGNRQVFPPQSAMAHVYMAAKQDVMGSTEINTVTRDEMIGAYRSRRWGLNVKTGLHLVMDREGELDLSEGYGLMPLRKIFVDVGKEGVYETVRLMQMMRLYDLVVPITVVSTMPELPRAPGMIGQALGICPKPFTPNLIIPRIKTLENLNPLRTGLERELEEAEEETRHRAKREMREHDVVSHVRRIAHGYRASGSAVAAAAEYGIRLAENETFVKKHTRGGGEHVGVHRAKVRPLPMDAEPDG